MLERVRKKKGAKEEKKYSRYAGLSGTKVSKKKRCVLWMPPVGSAVTKECAVTATIQSSMAYGVLGSNCRNNNSH